MKISLLSFTKNGFETEKQLVRILEKAGYLVCPYVMGKYAMQAAAKDTEISFSPVREGGLSQWAGERFADSEGIVFVGALGIAVRAVAPYIKDKKTDPAVLAVDEAARFVIPLLSGHLGGANELAKFLSMELKKNGSEAIPVITTATDVNKKFAVDVFAKEHGLAIGDMRLAKEISAAVLSGEPVGFFSDFSSDASLPEGLFRDRLCRRNIRITIWKKKESSASGDHTPKILRLVPGCVALGIGCRRGTGKEKLLEVIWAAAEENNLDLSSVCALSSIDLKAGEPGIRELAGEFQVPFLTYTKEELETVPGMYTESEFVRKTTGVGNVCERAAMAACLEVSQNARLLIKKHAADGVTVAAACFAPELFEKTENKSL